MKAIITILMVFTLSFFVKSQNFNVNLIPEELSNDAYAVVRLDNLIVNYQNYNKVSIVNEYAVTVLKKAGLKHAFHYESYDKKTKINKFEATIYDASGEKIRKLKSKDFKDISAADGYSIYLDDRVKYYEFTPTTYPFTIHYYIETSSSNTLFLPKWIPVGNYDIAIENSSFTFTNSSPYQIRKKEENFDRWNVEKNETSNSWTYSSQNIPPIKDEVLSPYLNELMPVVIFAPVEFELEGRRGKFENWQDFGKWYYDNLLQDKQDLSAQEKQTILQLVEGVSDPVEKVRILYQYMQNKTRYINVSIGIGGWEPYPASYVSNKSYGDCKALSNYMMSILQAVGIDAFHTVISANPNKKIDIDKDFAYMQGNHMIINVPTENDTLWLECTNQQTAFNYLGKFTDDRFALSVTPEGGKIVRTQNFPPEVNKEVITGKGEILPNGNLKTHMVIKDSGLRYDLTYQIGFENSQEQGKKLNDWFSHLPNLNIKNYEFENDRENAVFTTTTELESGQFAKIFGNNMTLNIVPFSRSAFGLKKDNNRKYPFEIRFGYTDEMEYELKIPKGYTINQSFEPLIHISEFGSYFLTLEVINSETLKIMRKLLVKDGIYPKEKFNDYVDFRRKISSLDNTKILLEKL